MIALYKKHLLTMCLMGCAAFVWAGPNPTPKKQGYEAYPLTRSRNIFDSERQPGAATAGSSAVQASTPSPSNADFAALTGTLITADKALAFFSGSRPEFNVVLSTKGNIAGAVVTKINSSSIEIERSGKRTTVAVGQTVPLNASSAPTAAPGITAPSPTDAAPSVSSAPVQGADREALMRRMMEKRQQELK